ncbi:hypothetical protein BaRGS_00000459 [Batillaria attramentaria]|uniref:Secreted protein n=1 Tax=Batillaria attramentaria TaxID=370345 RepID=A0ABD0M8G7_9CAEN
MKSALQYTLTILELWFSPGANANICSSNGSAALRPLLRTAVSDCSACVRIFHGNPRGWQPRQRRSVSVLPQWYRATNISSSVVLPTESVYGETEAKPWPRPLSSKVLTRLMSVLTDRRRPAGTRLVSLTQQESKVRSVTEAVSLPG